MNADTTALSDEAVKIAARAGSAILGLDFDDLDATDRNEAIDYHRKVLTAALPALTAEVEVPDRSNCVHGVKGGCRSYRCGSNCSQTYDRMHPCLACSIDDMVEYRDEAERLRDICESWKRENAMVCNQRDAARAEVESARAHERERIAQAIEAMVERDYNTAHCSTPGAVTIVARGAEAGRKAAAIARAVLADPAAATEGPTAKPLESETFPVDHPAGEWR